jgi:hypothetical protein
MNTSSGDETNDLFKIIIYSLRDFILLLAVNTARPCQYGNNALIQRFGRINPRFGFGRLDNCSGVPKGLQGLADKRV